MMETNQTAISLENIRMMPLSNVDLIDVYWKARTLRLSEDFIRLVERALHLRNIETVSILNKED